jgi:hypothetical protein
MKIRSILFAGTTIAAGVALSSCAGRDAQPISTVQQQDAYSDCSMVQAEIAANNQKGPTARERTRHEGCAERCGRGRWPCHLARLVRNGFQGRRGSGRRKPTSSPTVSDTVSRAALRARIPTPVTDDRRPLFVSRSSCAIASPITLKKMTMRSPATHEPLMATMMTNSLAASSTVSAPAMTGRLRLGWNFRSLNNVWRTPLAATSPARICAPRCWNSDDPFLRRGRHCGQTGDNVVEIRKTGA